MYYNLLYSTRESSAGSEEVEDGGGFGRVVVGESERGEGLVAQLGGVPAGIGVPGGFQFLFEPRFDQGLVGGDQIVGLPPLFDPGVFGLLQLLHLGQDLLHVRHGPNRWFILIEVRIRI